MDHRLVEGHCPMNAQCLICIEKDIIGSFTIQSPLELTQKLPRLILKIIMGAQVVGRSACPKQRSGSGDSWS